MKPINALVVVKAFSLSVLLLLAACATTSTPVSSEQLAAARSSFDSAERAGAREYAPVVMQSAEDKIDRAQQALQQANYDEAARLAAQAQTDAQLAEASSQSAKAKNAAQELQRANETLRQEINNSPSNP